jgi:hypothetical protein
VSQPNHFHRRVEKPITTRKPRRRPPSRAAARDVTTPSVMAELDHLIAEAAPEERPGLIVALSARLAALGAGMTGPARLAEVSPPEPAGQWIRPERAAEIAGEPIDTPEAKRRAVRRIYAWAQGQRWASRPTRRCLRIEEAGFRRWLKNRHSA